MSTPVIRATHERELCVDDLGTRRGTALIVSSVPPAPVDNGKRAVLRGLLEHLADRLGPDRVHYALIGSRDADLRGLPCTVHHLDKPTPLAQLRSVVQTLPFSRTRTLQECVLDSRDLRRDVARLVEYLQPTLEIYDTLRLAQHQPYGARASHRLVYLDDLFSIRYRRLLEVATRGDGAVNPLGEFAANVPRPARWLASRPTVYVPLLRFERRRIEAREVEVLREFDLSLLISPDEVEALRQRSGQRRVRVIPPLLPEISPVPHEPAQPVELVFLGRLNIPHNDDGLCAFLREALPGLRRALPDAVIRVVGKDPSPTLRRLAGEAGEAVRLEGFVEDLDGMFSRATALLAPLRFGSGVKIKVLEALARGVPVLATRTAVEGIPVRQDEEALDGCLVEDDLQAWPRLVQHIADPERNGRASLAARQFYLAQYGQEVVRRQYDDLLGLRGPGL